MCVFFVQLFEFTLTWFLFLCIGWFFRFQSFSFCRGSMYPSARHSYFKKKHTLQSNSSHPSCGLWWDPRIAWFSLLLRWILEHVNLRSSRIHGCIFLHGTCWRTICEWLVWSDRLEYHDKTCHSLFNLLCLFACPYHPYMVFVSYMYHSKTTKCR